MISEDNEPYRYDCIIHLQSYSDHATIKKSSEKESSQKSCIKRKTAKEYKKENSKRLQKGKQKKSIGKEMVKEHRREVCIPEDCNKEEIAEGIIISNNTQRRLQEWRSI